jgi:hypothetical protein
MTTVSAVRSFAEITRMPAGEGGVRATTTRHRRCVPIAAVAHHQPLAAGHAECLADVAIALVFLAPADIILTGGRGVQVEPAEVGRNIGQDRVVGFRGLAIRRANRFCLYLHGPGKLLRPDCRRASSSPRLRVQGQAEAGVKRRLEGTADTSDVRHRRSPGLLR